MDSSKPALIVIDMQLVAFDAEITPPIVNGGSLLSRVSRLIDSSREAGVPVAYAQTSATSGSPYAEDTHGWQIHPDLAPAPGDIVFSKVGPSVFENVNFEAWLQRSGVSELIICGIWTEGCVSITASGALKRGYGVILAADGHGTVRENKDDAKAIVSKTNQLLSDRGATVADIKDVLVRLRGNHRP